MTEPIKLLVADDHVLFRKGIINLLSEQPDFLIIGEASSGPEAVQLARQQQPDVVLLDVHMPTSGGVEAVRTLKQESDVQIMMLTISSKDEDLKGALAAGADGYLLKNTDPDQLFQAIRQVAAGHGALSPEIIPKIMRTAATSQDTALASALSPREYEILVEVAKGATTAEIAVTLVISPNTVKTHIRRIMDKLQAANRTEAVARAAAMGLQLPH